MKILSAPVSDNNALNAFNKLIFYVGCSHYLGALIIIQSMILIAANWFDPRMIKIFFISTGAGALIFPFTYLISDVITEVYGYKNARFAVWVSLLANLVFMFYGEFIIKISTPLSGVNDGLKFFLDFNFKVVIVSMFSYLLSEQLNSFIVAKLKISFLGKYVGLRFVVSTLSAHFIGSIIYCVGVFSDAMSASNLLHFILGSWALMTSIELLMMPFFVRLAKKLKMIEQVDVYDKNTRFNFFALNSQYSAKANEFDCSI